MSKKIALPGGACRPQPGIGGLSAGDREGYHHWSSITSTCWDTTCWDGMRSRFRTLWLVVNFASFGILLTLWKTWPNRPGPVSAKLG